MENRFGGGRNGNWEAIEVVWTGNDGVLGYGTSREYIGRKNQIYLEVGMQILLLNSHSPNKE